MALVPQRLPQPLRRVRASASERRPQQHAKCDRPQLDRPQEPQRNASARRAATRCEVLPSVDAATPPVGDMGEGGRWRFEAGARIGGIGWTPGL
eukprot:134931-Chlamydomonas_euryale.AAC.1